MQPTENWLVCCVFQIGLNEKLPKDKYLEHVYSIWKPKELCLCKRLLSCLVQDSVLYLWCCADDQLAGDF